MHKRLVAAALAVMLSIGLVACDDDGERGDDEKLEQEVEGED